MNNLGLAFAWFTWHRLANGNSNCSHHWHQGPWYIVDPEYSEVWMYGFSSEVGSCKACYWPGPV